MRFGFHEYGTSFVDRFSGHKRLFTLILLMSGTIVLTLIYAMIQKVPLTIFAHDSSIQPIPSNYSAPLSENQETKKSDLQVIGFLPAWSVSQEVKVYPEYLDQIIFFGFTTDAEGNIQKKDKNDEYTFEWNTFTSRYFEDLREQAKKTNTKVLVSIKGLDNNKIESIFLHPTYRQNLIRQIKELVEGYKLDGVNIDFEYFSSKDSQIMTEHNRFFKDLNDEMKKIRSDIIVSSDVNATVVYRDGAYDMVKIADSIDQVIIMGYDYHWLESQEGGPVAPIEAEGDDPSITKTIDSIKGRVSSDKIILGIPLYGYEWQTKTQEKGSETIPDTGAVATYKRVRELESGRTDLSFHYDELSQSPWLVYKQNGNIKQIYYEDEKSLLRKLEFADNTHLEGVALWALGYEGNYIEPWQIIKEHIKGK